MRTIGLVLTLLCLFKVNAQETGTLKLYISPPPQTVMVDDTELKFGNTMVLKPGKYFLKAWAPNKKLLDTIVEIKAGDITSFFYRFAPSEEFLKQKSIIATYQAERNKHLSIPVMTTTLVAGALVFTYLKGNSVRQEALESYDEYKYANSNIDLKASEYTDLQSKYRGYVAAYYVEWGALAVSSYFLYKGIKWAKQNKAPTFDPPKNPLVLNGLGMTRDSFGNYVVGMTFNIGR